MQRLLLFLLNYRAFIFFVLLEAFCGWLIVQNNQYQSAAFFNSANDLAARTMKISSDVRSYFQLSEVNRQLAQENARLRDQLSDSRLGGRFQLDETNPQQEYQYVSAKIINKTTNRFHNFLTIDKGAEHGVEPGMGVIGPSGVVGKIKASSGNFSTVISVLNTEVLVSSLVTRTNTFCTTNWDGNNPRYSNLLYVPRHVQVQVGDTIITSGFNAIFPEGIPIGTIDQVEIEEEATFYQIKVKLTTDFSSLAMVYVIENPSRSEIDSLQVNTTEN